MHRTLRAVPLAIVLLVVTATAALGHASFAQREVPAESEARLVLRVPEEREGEGTVAVETLVPEGFEVVECPSEDGWTCETTTEGDDTVLVWTRDSGGGDAQLPIVVRTPADQGGYRWPTIQTYDSGTEAAWTQDAGEDRPAPTVTVGPPDAPVVDATDDPADHGPAGAGGDGGAEGDPDVEGEVVPSDTLPPTEPASTEFTPPASPSEPLDTEAPAQPEATTSPTPSGDPDDEGGIGLGRVALIVVLLAAALGAARMIRRGPAGGDPGGATEDPYDPGA